MKEQVRAATGNGRGKSLERTGSSVLSLGKIIIDILERVGKTEIIEHS